MPIYTFIKLITTQKTYIGRTTYFLNKKERGNYRKYTLVTKRSTVG